MSDDGAMPAQHFVKLLFATYPAATAQLLASEDKAFFLAISQRPGQKPVPFIPVLEVSFERDFVGSRGHRGRLRREPQRACTLRGPVAAKHAAKKDEPVKEVLDNIAAFLADRLAQRLYGGGLSRIPTADHLSVRASPLPENVTGSLGVERSVEADKNACSVGCTSPEASTWLEMLAGPRQQHWLSALLTSTTVQGASHVDNPMRRLFVPRRSQMVVMTLDGETPVTVALYGAACSHGQHKSELKVAVVRYDSASQAIDVTLFEDRRDVSSLYKPSMGYANIHDASEGVPRTSAGGCGEANDVEAFCAVVGNEGEAFKTARTDRNEAPMDFAIVTGWQATMKAIFPATIDDDLLKPAHLTCGFRRC
ncbi:uncharacterized protein B0H18DRAFT_950746 [Fomitopsis serialis]|uniref:uncharacterized protein n=1 Tax=Fomitopsis serialis TaxID=139415 RepID=UPI0020072229|nr:uncharacterized protein B0H18DRAFT_950746 [Neoantrodia serialis]KAH9936479.1 hypothetical protein B0H18DRAFT_950746 [Neoantrodia serialis]